MNNTSKMDNNNNKDSTGNIFTKYVINNPHGIFDVIKKQDFWKQLSDEIGGEFKIITTVARDLNKIRIKYNYRGHELMLTETDTKPLFIESVIESHNYSNLSIQVSENEFVERFISKFSSKMMKLNQSSFDEKYLIKSSDKGIALKLLHDLNISEAIVALEIFYLEVVSNENKNTLSIVFNVNRKVNSYDYLKSILALYCVFIDNLIGLKVIK